MESYHAPCWVSKEQFRTEQETVVQLRQRSAEDVGIGSMELWISPA